MADKTLLSAVRDGLELDAVQLHAADIAWLRAKVHDPRDPKGW